MTGSINRFDTAKVRLQIQNAPAATAAPVTTASPAVGAAAQVAAQPQRYKGLIDCLSRIVREEGVTAPWRGVSAGIQRQCAFAPIRIGLYEPVRAIYMGKDFVGQPTVLQKIAAGLTTSAIGITVASPTDVVKVRLQAEGRLPPGVPRRYAGALDAYSKIVKQEGILGLWTGYGPNLARNCVVNATELVAYDQTKTVCSFIVFLSIVTSSDCNGCMVWTVHRCYCKPHISRMISRHILYQVYQLV
jgi:solute carrier family 25 uncoupling protein 8/9